MEMKAEDIAVTAEISLEKVMRIKISINIRVW